MDYLDLVNGPGERPQTKTAFRNHREWQHISGLRKVPKKGRPPPGGEEAEVVVYQPRGVGLMHTRHKPGKAHYTHASRLGRKCCALRKDTQFTEVSYLRHLS